MDFSQLLAATSIDPKLVLVLRHAPPAILTNLLPAWASDEPVLFNAYQQTQGERAEASMKKAQYVASFIGMEVGEALFVGLYKVVGHQPVSQKKLWSLRAYRVMDEIGLRKISGVAKRQNVLLFDLELSDWYSNWKGRLVIEWPPSRTWARWADRNGFAVKSIMAESALARPIKAWQELVLTYEDLQNLPKAWRAELARWRGIYLIVDTSDRKPYVGSARGVENIFGRWADYAKGRNGGNKLMRGRDPKKFRFSVLELTAPEISASDLVALENRWKARLSSRHPHGLNAN